MAVKGSSDIGHPDLGLDCPLPRTPENALSVPLGEPPLFPRWSLLSPSNRVTSRTADNAELFALSGDAAWAVNSHGPAWHHEPGKTCRMTRCSVYWSSDIGHRSSPPRTCLGHRDSDATETKRPNREPVCGFPTPLVTSGRMAVNRRRCGAGKGTTTRRSPPCVK